STPGGIIAGGAAGVKIVNNLIEENDEAIQVYGDAWWNSGLTANDIVISGNTVRDNVYGIGIGPLAHNTEIIDNIIENNTATGFYIYGDSSNGDPSGVVLVRNRIVGNGAGVFNITTNVVNAARNYWGAADGPSDFGSGDFVSAMVNFIPF